MKLNHLLLAGALACATASSFAAPGDPVPLLPTGPGMFGASFTQTVDDGSFFDDFSFLPGSFAGLVSVTLSSLTGPVSFFTASINDQNFGYMPELGQPDFSFQSQVSADVPLTLSVFRAVEDADGNPVGTGSYRVAITAAVPEPQTWALLLLGLAGLGMVTRRRQAGATPAGKTARV